MSDVNLSERKAIAKTAYIYGVPIVEHLEDDVCLLVDKGNPNTRARSIPF